MSEYEVVFVIKATETDEATDALIAQMEEVAKGQGAELLATDRWGRRKLAYEIGKDRDGNYVLLHLRGGRAAVAELERKFRMSDSIIRFLTVRVDDEIRRARRKATLRARKKGLDPSQVTVVTTRRPREDEVVPRAPVESDEDEAEGEER